MFIYWLIVGPLDKGYRYYIPIDNVNKSLHTGTETVVNSVNDSIVSILVFIIWAAPIPV